MTRGPLRLVILGALALVPSIVAVLLFANAASGPRQELLARLLYWSMPLLVGIAAATWIRRLRHRDATTAPSRLPRRGLALGIAFAVALTTALFVAMPPRMRVQFDETSLVGTSQNMHEQRMAVMTTGAVPWNGSVVRLENTVDKRPPLFAFVTSLGHDVCGQSPANAFAVNAVTLAIVLLLVFVAAWQRLGLLAATAAPLLLLAVPLTGVTATSAGFELLAATLLLAAMLAAVDFVSTPTAVRWSSLIGLTLLLAASRYESLLAAALLAVTAAWLARGRWRCDRFGMWLTAATPTLLAPLLLLFVHSRDPNFYPEAGGGELLAWSHLAAHTPPFVTMAFADWRGALPGALSLVAAIAWLVRITTRRGTRTDLLVVVPVLALTTLALAWFFGDIADPMALRLFLPFCWLAALSPLLLVRGRRTALALLLGAASLFAFRLHDLRTGRAFPSLPSAELTAELDRLVPSLAADARTTLWVGMPAQHLIVNGHAALCAKSFAARAGEVQQLVARGDIRTIYLLTTPLDAAFAPAFGDPRELLRAQRHEVVVAGKAPLPITVYRLHP
jgi:hypothetical protein